MDEVEFLTLTHALIALWDHGLEYLFGLLANVLPGSPYWSPFERNSSLLMFTVLVPTGVAYFTRLRKRQDASLKAVKSAIGDSNSDGRDLSSNVEKPTFIHISIFFYILAALLAVYSGYVNLNDESWLLPNDGGLLSWVAFSSNYVIVAIYVFFLFRYAPAYSAILLGSILFILTLEIWYLIPNVNDWSQSIIAYSEAVTKKSEIP